MSETHFVYTTLNNADEARKVGRAILDAKLANCVNFFPITCIYNYEGEITEEPEVVLIIKMKAGNFAEVEKIIKSHIDYTNFIGEFAPENVNGEFEEWLCSVCVPSKKD